MEFCDGGDIYHLIEINDPNIVSYKEAFFEESENCLCLVMEFCDGGDIYHNVKKIIPISKKWIFENISLI